MLTGAFSPSGAPAGGRKRWPKRRSPRGEDCALLGQRQVGCDTTSGVIETVPGCSSLEVEDVVVGGGRRPHGIFHFEDDWGRRPGCGPPPERVDQAALDSIWCTLDCGAPLMAIRRGFMASGISRTSSIFSRPLSKDASLTWT